MTSTPVIALTANVLSHQRETYLAAGMDGVVGKPISPAIADLLNVRLGSKADVGAGPASGPSERRLRGESRHWREP